MPLPVALYSSAQVRELDACEVAQGVPSYTLMKRAGEAALRVMRSRWPTAHRIVVVCGGGNNGGDGYVLARFAQAAGLTVTTLAAVPPAKLTGDARHAYEDLVASGASVLAFDPALLGPAAAAARGNGSGIGRDSLEVVVDAVLGTGAQLPVRTPLQEVMRAINESARPVFALDLPSGLDPNTGAATDATVRADCTLTFVGLKSGLFLGAGPEHAGTLHFDDLEVPVPEDARFHPRLVRLTEAEIARALPRRPRNAHKGSFGKVLIVGGGPGMPGAARLAGEAALRVGAGLVTVGADAGNLAAIAGSLPELICLSPGASAEADEAFAEALRASDVVAIGPGLGRSAWASRLLQQVVLSGKPLVVDADALNLIAAAGVASFRAAAARWILTPHPGEAARLLGCSTGQIQQDRLAAVQELQERCGGIVVLKGAGTLIAGPGAMPSLCERGNPGLASPGTGDVLTGTIAGILAQCGDPLLAARAGVLAHALAGDALARGGGERGLLASELARELRAVVNR